MEQSPYKPPQAEVKDSGSLDAYKRSVWWKVYFFFTVSLSVFNYYFVLTDPVAGLTEYFLLALWLIVQIGLFGFVFSRPILGPKFWFIIIFADIAYSILYSYVGNIDMQMDSTDTEYLVGTVITWIISVPAYLGLYFYSRPSDRAWRGSVYVESDGQK